MTAVPSIQELRVIAQKTKLHRKEWHYVIHRRLSIYLTWFLLHTRITANQVSAISLLLGIVATAMVLSENVMCINAGFLLYYSYFLLDKVDGEIARFRGTETIKGIFLDYIGHLVIPSLVPLAVGGYLAKVTDSDALWLFGFAGALACMFKRSARDIPLAIVHRKYLEQAEMFELEISKAESKKRYSGNTRVGKKQFIRIILNVFGFSNYFWTIIFILGVLHYSSVFYRWMELIYISVFIFACLCQVLDSVILIRNLFCNLNNNITGVMAHMRRTMDHSADFHNIKTDDE